MKYEVHIFEGDSVIAPSIESAMAIFDDENARGHSALVMPLLIPDWPMGALSQQANELHALMLAYQSAYRGPNCAASKQAALANYKNQLLAIEEGITNGSYPKK